MDAVGQGGWRSRGGLPSACGWRVRPLGARAGPLTPLGGVAFALRVEGAGVAGWAFPRQWTSGPPSSPPTNT